MKTRDFLRLSTMIFTVALICAGFNLTSAAAQEYNAHDEFALTQGGTNGVWSYGYSTSNADNTLNLFSPATDTTTAAGCNGGVFEVWRIDNPQQIPQISRHNPAANCINVPANALFVHPGFNGQRAVVRWTAPASGTFQLTGSLQRQNLSATTDLKILKNAATAGEVVVFSGSNASTYQISYNVTVTVQAGDKLDFSVGDGDGNWSSDGSSIVINISQPVTACLTAPANLQVFVPGENSPSDVQSVNTNASLVGDASYTNAGKVRRAFDFDGSGDYVRIEDNPAQRPATALTVEGWFKFDGTGGLISLVSKPIRNSALNSYNLYIENGQLRGLIGNASQYTRVFSNFTPQTGVWHHLAFTYDLSGGISTLKLYANGADVTGSQDGTANLPISYDANPYPLLIGGEYENNAPGFFLDGQADEVSIYGRALSQTEIFDIVQQGSFGKCAPGSSCVSAPQGLISFYKGENNALDSNSQNPGSLVNGANFANGRVGQAFNFPTVNDFVSVPDSPSLRPTNLTLEGWFNFSAAPSGVQILASKNAAVGNSFVIYYDNGFLRGQTSDGNGTFGNPVSVPFAPTLGQWYHIAYSWQNGGNEVLYVNGTAVDANQADVAPGYTNNPFTIGAGGGFSFRGRADEISIYNRALAASEVSAIYNAAGNGKCLVYSCVQTPNNLVSWFAGEQNALDSRSNNHGTLQNGATFATGRVGQAFRFDGVDDFVAVPDSNSLDITGDLTIEAWVSPAQIQTGEVTLVDKREASNNNINYVLFLRDGQLNFASRSNGSTPNENFSGVTLTAGTFSHVAVTIQNGTLRFYVNGVSSAALTAPATRIATNGRLTVGATETGGTSGFFNGLIDELSIYNRALSAVEIQSIVSAGSSGKCKPSPTNPTANLIGFWAGEGDARDIAGEDQNGTNNGATFKVGKVGQAFNFTANQQNVLIPDSAAMRPANFTIEAWAKSTDNSGVRHIFAKTLGSGTSDSYVFWIQNGNLNASICSANNTCAQIAAPVFNALEWHHVAFTFDDATDSLRLYVDGEQVTNGSTSLSVGYDTHAALIGADYANEVITDTWSGQLDEVSFYDRALSQSELAAVYQSGTAGKLKGKPTLQEIITAPQEKDSVKENSMLQEMSPQAVTTTLASATVTFPSVTQSGITTESGVDLAQLPALPSYATATGLAFDVSTTAVFSGSPTVCFNVPSLTPSQIQMATVLHLENINGTQAWVNRTSSRSSGQICASGMTTLSPFAIVQGLAPTASTVTISGRILTAEGRAIRNARIVLTELNGNTRTVLSGAFGNYRFADIPANQTVTIEVSSKRFIFTEPVRVLNVAEELKSVDFITEN